MKKHLYLLSIPMRGSQFGVGTYLRELIRVCKKSSIRVCLVTMASGKQEFQVEEAKGVTYIHIPEPVKRPSGMEGQEYMDILYSNSVYILKPYVDPEADNIFHINFLQSKTLAVKLKELFSCKVVMTLHYTEWSFLLSGNRQKLYRLKKKKI